MSERESRSRKNKQQTMNSSGSKPCSTIELGHLVTSETAEALFVQTRGAGQQDQGAVLFREAFGERVQRSQLEGAISARRGNDGEALVLELMRRKKPDRGPVVGRRETDIEVEVRGYVSDFETPAR